MEMTHEDIVASYRQAKNKKSQIGVLAELNATDTASIRAVLIDAGELKPDQPVNKTSPEQLEKVKELLEAGLSMNETARRTGVSQPTVSKYAKQYGWGVAVKSTKTKLPPEHVSKLDTMADVSVHDRVEAVIRALPDGADEDTRVCAFDLCMRMLRSDLLQRLNVDR